MVWNKTVPTSSTYIIDIPSIFQANYTEAEDIMGVEHYTYSSALSGRHKPGILEAVYVGTTVQIAALTGCMDGAISLDSTLGAMKIYNGAASAWKQLNLDPYPIVDVYRTGDQTVASAAAGTYVGIIFNTEIVDSMSAFNSTLGKFVSPASGYYLIRSQVSFTGSEGGVGIRIACLLYNSGGTLQYSPIAYYSTLDTSPVTLEASLLLSIPKDSYIIMSIWHDSTSSQTIDGGQDCTWLKIYKLS